MRLAKRFITLEPATFTKPIDNARRCLEALTLSIVYDPRAISTAM